MENNPAEKLNCLSKQKEKLGEACSKKVIFTTLQSLEESPCKDEVRAKCGNQIDKLKEKLEESDFMGIFEAASEVSACIVEHGTDLWNKCVRRNDPNPEEIFDPIQCKGEKDDFGSLCNHNCDGKCCPKGACLFGKCASTTCKKRDDEEIRLKFEEIFDPIQCKGEKDDFGSLCNHNCDGKCCPKGACLFGKCASTTCKKRDDVVQESSLMTDTIMESCKKQFRSMSPVTLAIGFFSGLAASFGFARYHQWKLTKAKMRVSNHLETEPMKTSLI